jgi:hypothetical protein
MRLLTTRNKGASLLFAAVLLWCVFPGILAASPSSDPPVTLTTPFQLGHGTEPDIYVEEGGDIHVAWKDVDLVRYRYNGGSSWGSTETPNIGGVGVSEKSAPSVWADSNGDPHIVWGPEDGPIYYINKVGGSWSSKVTVVPTQSGYTVRDCQIAVGSNGIRHVVWRKSGSSDSIWYKNYQNGSWGSAVQISQGSTMAKRPHVAIGSNNEFHVVWRQRGGPGNSYEVMYRKWANGSWGNVEMATNTSAQANEDPHVALDSSNNPHVSFPEGTSAAYIKRSGGDWTDIVILASTGLDPVVAVDDNNAIYVAYDEHYRYNTGSGWSTAQVYDDGGYMPDAYGDGQYAHIVYRKNTNVYYTSVSAGGGPPPEKWITVTDPNGGEVWEPGSIHNITWNWSGGISNVKISGSTNSGSTWTTLVESTACDGSYSWTVPNTPSQDCRVKIADVGDSNVYDISDADFTIGPGGGDQWITVTDPNGGEVWTVGSAHEITWESSDDFDYVRLDYSTNGGSNWIQICSKTSNDGSRDWTVPNTPSGNCRVRVQSKSDASVQDMSDANFTISAGAGAPGLTLSGGEVPHTFELLQNYPNPFNPSTEIRFDIPAGESGTVRAFITVYDARGRLVRRLLDEDLPAGAYRLHWDGRSDSGESLASGIYLLHLQAGRDRGTVKMLLTR